MSKVTGESRTLAKRKWRRSQARQTSVSTPDLDQNQIQELKAMFNFIDEDRDGIVSQEDLRSILVSLGQKPSAKETREMLEEAKGDVDFSRFLSLFASMMVGTGDSHELVRNAFTCFDEDRDGVINLDDLRELLTTMGVRLTDQQVSVERWRS